MKWNEMEAVENKSSKKAIGDITQVDVSFIRGLAVLTSNLLWRTLKFLRIELLFLIWFLITVVLVSYFRYV